jgi:hypothetical protein
MNEIRELIDIELDAVSGGVGGVSDLGNYITKAINDALGGAIGGGNRDIDPGFSHPIGKPNQLGPNVIPL